MAEAGLRRKKPHRKSTEGEAERRGTELSFHCLRHTAVTLMKEAGIPAAVVMELVGHDSEAMSAHYTHVGAEAMQRAADSLPDLPRRITSLRLYAMLSQQFRGLAMSDGAEIDRLISLAVKVYPGLWRQNPIQAFDRMKDDVRRVRQYLQLRLFSSLGSGLGKRKIY